MNKNGYVYILASRRNGTLYIGVTSNPVRRISEHKSDIQKGFTEKNKVHYLVYIEKFDRITDAMAREKQLKHWNRAWKIRIIEEMNPEWNDISSEL